MEFTLTFTLEDLYHLVFIVYTIIIIVCMIIDGRKK